MKFVLVNMVLALINANAFAADLSQIFSAETKASLEAQEYITKWLKNNCRDLNWALSVKEIPQRREECSGTIEKVHLNVELSHLNSELIFWISKGSEKTTLEWIYEEFPSWRLCSYSEAYFREDKSCQ